MKTQLQLKHSQQLAITPQLKQVLRLMQLSNQELAQEMQLALDSNPLLQQEEEIQQEESEDGKIDLLEDLESLQSDNNETELDLVSDGQELPLDSNWEEISPSDYDSFNYSSGSGEEVFDTRATSISLQDYLQWQADLTPFSPIDATIAKIIIESVDDNGYLNPNLNFILETLETIGINVIENAITIKDVEIVLKRLQHFDPLGVFARSLQESLILQLSVIKNHYKVYAIDIIENDLELVARKDFRSLMRNHKLKENELAKILTLIHSLNPRPGNLFATKHADYITPDVIMHKVNGKWELEINNSSFPKIGINNYYATIDTSNKEDKSYIKKHLQDAKLLLSGIELRNATLFKVASFIVSYQLDFFEHGPLSMRPMILTDVATHVEIHESTVSRITTNKYIYTPRGLFELKYFFSSSIKNDDKEHSSTTIRAILAELIKNEDSKKPLSDSKLVAILKDKGIDIARRTIAKYRESLGIPPSNQRKSLL